MAKINMTPEKTKMPEQNPDIRNRNFLEVATGYTPEMAQEEAMRCLNCKHKPCVSGSPILKAPKVAQRTKVILIS